MTTEEECYECIRCIKMIVNIVKYMNQAKLTVITKVEAISYKMKGPVQYPYT